MGGRTQRELEGYFSFSPPLFKCFLLSLLASRLLDLFGFLLIKECLVWAKGKAALFLRIWFLSGACLDSEGQGFREKQFREKRLWSIASQNRKPRGESMV